MTEQGRIFSLKSSTALILLVISAVTFSHIHQGTLGVDAIRYASIARHIVETGRWFPLYDSYAEEVYYNKPPVLFWMVATSFKLLGYSTFSARIVGALFTFGGLLLLWNTVKSLYGESLALFSVLMITSNADFFRSIVDLNFEGIMLCAGALLLHAGLNRVRNGRYSAEDRMRMAIGVFLFLITKPPAILFVVPAFLSFDWYAAAGAVIIRKAGKRLALAAGICLFGLAAVLVVVPLDFVVHTMRRQFLEPFIFTHGYSENLVSWGKNIFGFLAPASLVGLAAVFMQPKQEEQIISTPERRFLLLWLLPVVAVIFVTESRTRYLHIPLLSMAILGAEYLNAKIGEVGFNRLKRLLGFGAPAMWTAVLLGLPLHGSDAVVSLFTRHPELLERNPIVCAGGNLHGDIYAPSVKRQDLLLQFTFNRKLNVLPPEDLISATASKDSSLVVANRKCLDSEFFPNLEHPALISGSDAKVYQISYSKIGPVEPGFEKRTN